MPRAGRCNQSLKTTPTSVEGYTAARSLPRQARNRGSRPQEPVLSGESAKVGQDAGLGCEVCGFGCWVSLGALGVGEVGGGDECRGRGDVVEV